MIKNKGYLLILAIALIVIVGFISTMLVSLHVRSSEASSAVDQSTHALNILSSGLQIAKRDIITNGVTCTGINNHKKYTNAPLFNGQFTVTGAASTSSGNLSTNIQGLIRTRS